MPTSRPSPMTIAHQRATTARTIHSESNDIEIEVDKDVSRTMVPMNEDPRQRRHQPHLDSMRSSALTQFHCILSPLTTTPLPTQRVPLHIAELTAANHTTICTTRMSLCRSVVSP
eukprot:2089242-Amphidinium_carterae.1